MDHPLLSGGQAAGLFTLITFFIVLVAFALGAAWCKNRQRDDDLEAIEKEQLELGFPHVPTFRPIDPNTVISAGTISAADIAAKSRRQLGIVTEAESRAMGPTKPAITCAPAKVDINAFGEINTVEFPSGTRSMYRAAMPDALRHEGRNCVFALIASIETNDGSQEDADAIAHAKEAMYRWIDGL